MTTFSPTELVSGLTFGESPRYRDGLLYVSDMIGRAIYTIDTKTGSKQVLVEVPEGPNGMCFHPDGSLIYSSMFDAKLWRLRGGKSTLYADLSALMTGYCGDMVIDHSGRVYVDDIGVRPLHGEGNDARLGRLIVVETDGTVKSAAEDLSFPNAVFISADGKTLFVAETFREGLLKFDIGVAGELSNRRAVWSPSLLPDVKKEEMGKKMIGVDGGCMDAEGGMWLSLVEYHQFVRIDGDGNVTHRVEVNGHATACTLGGEDGKILFMVVNNGPEDEHLFAAMKHGQTSCAIVTAKVETGRGDARP